MNAGGKSIGYLMVFGSGMLWGCIGVFVTLLKNLGGSSFLIAFCRLFFGCIILAILLFFTKGLKGFIVSKKILLICLVYGILCHGLFNICYNESIRQNGVATGSILLYTSPVFATVMSVIFYKEKMVFLKYIALVLNIIGCVLTVTGGNFGSLNFSVSGVLFGVASGFLFGLTHIFGKLISQGNDPMAISFYAFGFASLFLIPFAKPFSNLPLLLNPTFAFIAIMYGLFISSGSYILYLNGMKRGISSSNVSVIVSIEAVVASLFGFILFKEPYSLVTVLGIILVFASILMENGRDVLSFLTKGKKA